MNYDNRSKKISYGVLLSPNSVKNYIPIPWYA